jgi:hypothetical protein
MAVVIIAAGIATHVIPGLAPTPWLDNLTLIVAGVLFGVQTVQNGTQNAARQALAIAQQALDMAQAAQRKPPVQPPTAGSSLGSGMSSSAGGRV